MELETIWDQIYDAGTKPPLERAKLLDSLLFVLEDMVQHRPSAELWYAIGYAYYVHPEKSDRMDSRVLSSLFRACEIDPLFASPKLLLGNFYYDKSNYCLALGYFKEAANAKWNEYYRVFIQEMILCSELSVYGVHATMPRLEQFVLDCLQAEKDDVFPVQLIRCCLRVFPESKNVDTLKAAVQLLRKLVAGIEQESVFRNDLDHLASLTHAPSILPTQKPCPEKDKPM